MVGLAHLVKTVLGKKTRLTRDGLINRSENRAMVELLGLELTPMDEIEWEEGDVAVMVDSQPKTGRHSNEKALPLVAVIDHHDTPGNVRGIPLWMCARAWAQLVRWLQNIFASKMWKSLSRLLLQ